MAYGAKVRTIGIGRGGGRFHPGADYAARWLLYCFRRRDRRHGSGRRLGGRGAIGGGGRRLTVEGPYTFKARPVGADGPLGECVVCHSVETGGPLRVAPPLHGIVGARKARANWYAYSAALRRAAGDWTEADLDKYLASPSTFLPGTTKPIAGIADPKQRADIIAALKAAP